MRPRRELKPNRELELRESAADTNTRAKALQAGEKSKKKNLYYYVTSDREKIEDAPQVRWTAVEVQSSDEEYIGLGSVDSGSEASDMDIEKGEVSC